MWPFAKKQPRRAEAHRTRVQARPSFWQRLAVPGGVATILIGLGFAVVAAIILLFGEFGDTQQRSLVEPWRELYRFAVVLVVLAITAAMGKYLASYQSRVLRNHTRTVSVAVLLLLALAVGRLFSLLNWPVMLLLIPALFVPVILTITYNQRMALGVGGFFAILMMLTTTRAQRGALESTGLFSVFLVVIAAMTVAVFSLREIRSRSKIIEVGIVTGISAGLAVWVMGLVSYWSRLSMQETSAQAAKEILYNSFWAVGAAIAVGLLIQGVLPLVERVFRVATSMTLLEWCDASRPLLKHLALEAPGTYNHSLQVGTIAELAAEAIGANGLLCRVGSYYHDVGKIAKASYFVENQAGQSSKHEKLTPAMSSLVILGHVKDGVEIAKEYGLPRVLHQFIRQHHGTSLVEYFYHEARKRDPDGKVHESEYRHAGPKPQTPETGIVMLADTVESAVRALPEPTANRIELTVHNLLMKRLMDGQFDECDLTLRQLHIVEENLIKSLCSMYHARVPYPEPETGSADNNNAEPKNNNIQSLPKRS
ncbi:MAG: HDIG domain-containing protein [Actinobacteria bacterium]|nr:HDIG domain-containing protein [Actinomycetota bacterium]